MGARARTSTTNALATVSSMRSLDRRSPRRRDRSPPCSFRFSTCGARGRWGRGRERTRQRDPSEGARAWVSTDVYGNTSWRRFPSGCARVRLNRPRIRPLGGFARHRCGWRQDARRGRRSMGRTSRENRTVTDPTGGTGVSASDIFYNNPPQTPLRLRAGVRRTTCVRPRGRRARSRRTSHAWKTRVAAQSGVRTRSRARRLRREASRSNENSTSSFVESVRRRSTGRGSRKNDGETNE